MDLVVVFMFGLAFGFLFCSILSAVSDGSRKEEELDEKK